MMLENEAFDVESRRNKWGGGYCTEFVRSTASHSSSQTSTARAGDVDVVTHEAGHALNAWLIADNRFALELDCGGMETAETHSMSMEFFAWPYMDEVLPGDGACGLPVHARARRFLFHARMAPTVDEFQHIIYARARHARPAERSAVVARSLRQKYRPHIVQSRAYLISKSGTRWQYQMHIYETSILLH